LGGPMVIHSPWWIEEHWGRAFEILSLAPDGFASKPWLDHGWVLMRKRDISIDADALERIAPGDEREARALAHNVKQLHNECLDLRAGLSYFEGKVEEQSRQLAAQTADLDREHEAAEEARQETHRAYQEVETLRQEMASLQREIHSARQQATAARERSLNSATRLLEVEEVLAQSKARIFALEEALDTLTPQLERADRIMAAMQGSVSWRITAPLRALKRRR
jgi:chromosome segregation ATPase